MKCQLFCLTGAALILFNMAAPAEIKVTTAHNPNDSATAGFKFKNVPGPSKTDAGGRATLALVDGQRDGNGGDLDKLQDGKAPTEEDQPSENFFFRAGSDGGRLQLDLGAPIEIKQINSFSWHSNTRAPQVYKLFGSDGKKEGFNALPKKDTDPEKCGWKQIASVDTRPKEGEPGGQYAVNISDSDGVIGNYRYLLFDISRTEEADAFGNTFYSEIDVIGKDDAVVAANAAAPAAPYVIRSSDDYCEITIDTSGAPELKEWAEQKLAPALAEWYPKIMAMLPSEGFSAPKKFSVAIRPGNGVAATGGTRVTANSAWLKGELKKPLGGEAVGAIIHEEVHVIQQYGYARRNNPNATRSPGWLTEAIPDYIRWFLYEPQSHGADLVWMRARRMTNFKYDSAYRVGANFLAWTTEKYDKDIVRKLNAAARGGTYSEDLWKVATGKTAPELGDEWKQSLQEQIGSKAEAKINALTDDEKKAGWTLLFNGKDLDGWHNFKKQTIRPGWQVTNSALACVDPHNAGDLCTKDQYDWFELQLDYNISEGGNSGIIYHATDQGGAAWATGPEFQLEDNAKAADPIRCGWLYQLYQPPDDPKTGKPLDATKPPGQWNHVRLLISPDKCEHEINGVKYFDYVLGSDDFKQRVAKSKFGSMPLFAKSDKGYITLQGDHGQVSFRNIKVRTIAAKQ